MTSFETDDLASAPQPVSRRLSRRERQRPFGPKDALALVRLENALGPPNADAMSRVQKVEALISSAKAAAWPQRFETVGDVLDGLGKTHTTRVESNRARILGSLISTRDKGAEKIDDSLTALATVIIDNQTPNQDPRTLPLDYALASNVAQQFRSGSPATAGDIARAEVELAAKNTGKSGSQAR